MNDYLPAKFEGPQRVGPPLRYAEPVDHQAVAAPSVNKRLFHFIRKYWWVPLLSTVLALAAAAAFIRFSPPVYVSVGKMWETEKMQLPESGAFVQDLQNYLGTQIELLRSDKLRDLTLQRLKAEGTNNIPKGPDGYPLKVALRVTQTPKTAVLEVAAFCSDPAYARAFLNALMQEYLEYKKTVRKSVSGDTLASISGQALRLEQELKASQDSLTAFQQTNNLAILEEEGRIAGGHLAQLKTQLSDLKLEAQLLEATAVERDYAGPGRTNITAFMVTPLPGASTATPSAFAAERQTAVRDLEVLKMQREQLSKYLKPKHPKIVKLDADIDRGQKLLEVYRTQNQEELNASRQALKMRLESVQASIREWESKVVEANSRIAEAEKLKLNVSRTQSLYDRLVLMLQNVDVSRNLDRETLAIFEPASAPERYHFKDLLAVALALTLGVSVGLGIVFLVELRDDRFSSVLEIDEKFGDSVVGQVPEVRKLARGGMALLAEHGQDDMFSESYRNLRSALLFLPYEGERPKTLLITSALPNEGKSTIAANLAKSLALGGSRVLLVDGDMRKGKLHTMLELREGPGFSDLLANPALHEKVMQTNSLSNLKFVPRGTGSDSPGDLLLKPELDNLLAKWRQEFDYVLIDSPPVFAADDVTALANKVDGTLFVVRRRFSSEKAVREALELLLRRQARVLGLVFNRADASARSYYYYKYGEYHTSGRPA